MSNNYSFNDLPLTAEITEISWSIAAVKDFDFLASGTATVIAPFLAITAKHVIEHFQREYERKYVKQTEPGEHHHVNGSYNIFMFQILDGGANGILWSVNKIYLAPTSDIAYLFFEGFSPVPDNYQFKIASMEMRPPEIGSHISAFGYRKSRITFKGEGQIEWFDIPTNTTGIVKDIHQIRRDRIMINFPAIETNARFDGGMSGGPVFNSEGNLCAIISSNFPPVEEGDEHVSYAALIWVSMLTPLDIPFQEVELIPKPYPVIQLADSGIIKALNHHKLILENEINGTFTRIGFSLQ